MITLVSTAGPLNRPLQDESSRQLPISYDSFWRRLEHAAPGELIEYHHGFLAIDRTLPDGPFPSDIGIIGDIAFVAAAIGVAHLLQRRIGPYCFSYIVIMREVGLEPMRRLRFAVVDATRAKLGENLARRGSEMRLINPRNF